MLGQSNNYIRAQWKHGAHICELTLLLADQVFSSPRGVRGSWGQADMQMRMFMLLTMPSPAPRRARASAWRCRACSSSVLFSSDCGPVEAPRPHLRADAPPFQPGLLGPLGRPGLLGHDVDADGGGPPAHVLSPDPVGGHKAQDGDGHEYPVKSTDASEEDVARTPREPTATAHQSLCARPTDAACGPRLAPQIPSGGRGHLAEQLCLRA